MNLTVNEIFYSLQGEGGRTGQPSIFIRLAKCNLACAFCDTDFETGNDLSVAQILNEIGRFGCKWIVWTGGEPTLQLNDAIVAFFKQNGYMQAIETNGTRRVPDGIDYIACSPKQHFDNLRALISRADELRFPMRKGDPLPDTAILPDAERYFLSPIFDGGRAVPENIDYCVELVKNNPRWALSLQMHKLIGIR
ncbi:MAG: 7-carboxy-7-deazaguanine synthase QueE [Dysgonamonadaceae bacterium]|jgi:organic radical activating enzyme|nr:7-carboxy-7-deazaguanine synthase QueE [Dysgonamonadaceae bacterium]